jgi:metallo-beta-lactamase family protein
MVAKLSFLGGTGTVTGSKYLIELGERRILVDCGLFQGFKQLRLRNWKPFPVDPASIDAVLLTHAHIDHSGYLPLLIRNGFSGPVICTHATRDLCDILLSDSGFLQEREAELANRTGFSRHKPALPLYTQEDAERAMRQFRPAAFDRKHDVMPEISARFLRAGHILGAAIVELRVGERTIVFSGDLGRPDSPTMVDPAPVSHADYLLVESTYGDRVHDGEDPEEALAEVIARTTARGGTVIIPAFAVGRTQILLYHLQRLKAARRIPDVPIHLDSPMAQDATDIYRSHPDDHRLGAEQLRTAFKVARYVRSVEDSKALDHDPYPKVIVSASGMATGGRVLHHLKHYASDRRNTVLFAGFQAGGTRGAAMLAGAATIKIHGGYIPVHAEVANLPMLSAHADSNEVMAWLGNFKAPPKMTFVVHGEAAAADALRHRIKEELDWPCAVPEHQEQVELT